jgi:energy-converting hydrogenase A subunit M
MDGMIYLATIGDDLVCYESNHRREALKGLEDMAPILVDFLPNTTDDSLKDEFIRLNKAVSVPELYFSQDPEQLFRDLKVAVDDFCDIYKKHKVSTNKPQRPNFNRDSLMDEFYRIIKELSIDVEEFITRLSRYNRRLMLKEKTGLSQKVIDKCNETGLWIFAWSSKLDAKELI